MVEVSKVYNALIIHGYFTDEELALITSINGYSIKTLNDCIYARYGFHDFEQLTEEENK